MSGFNRSFCILRNTLKPLTTPKANISSMPAKHDIPAGEQTFAMVTLFISMLGPSGWVLSHLEEYKAH